MSEHFKLGSRCLVIREQFTTADGSNRLIYRPEVDTLDSVDLAVVDCVESHPLVIGGFDPNAPEGYYGHRFLGLGDSIWDCQFPTYVAATDTDDAVPGDVLVYQTTPTPDPQPYVHVGYVIGQLQARAMVMDAPPEEVQALNDHIGYLYDLINQQGLSGKIDVIQP